MNSHFQGFGCDGEIFQLAVGRSYFGILRCIVRFLVAFKSTKTHFTVLPKTEETFVLCNKILIRGKIYEFLVRDITKQFFDEKKYFDSAPLIGKK